MLSDAVAGLLDRRHIAVPAVASFVRRQAAGATAAEAAASFVASLRQLLLRSPHRAALLDQGPSSPEFRWLHADLSALDTFAGAPDLPRVQQLRRRIQRYFLTNDGEPRKKLAVRFKPDQFVSKAAKKAHEDAVRELAPAILTELDHLEARVNAMLARGLLRLLQIAAAKYETLLEEHALLDFAGMLERSVQLLSAQEEFARSRLKLQARYHHVLVDEFQDTSRLQWRLIELLVDQINGTEAICKVGRGGILHGKQGVTLDRFKTGSFDVALDLLERTASGAENSGVDSGHVLKPGHGDRCSRDVRPRPSSHGPGLGAAALSGAVHDRRGGPR